MSKPIIYGGCFDVSVEGNTITFIDCFFRKKKIKVSEHLLITEISIREDSGNLLIKCLDQKKEIISINDINGIMNFYKDEMTIPFL